MVLRLRRVTSLALGLALALLGCREFDAEHEVPAGAAGSEAAGAGPIVSAGGSAGSASGSGPGAASAGGSPDGSVQAVEPGTFSGLALWLTASQEWCTEGPDHEVRAWLDRSGNHNDATEVAGRQRPRFMEITLTGHPTLRFDGAPSNLMVPDAESLHFGEGDFVYVVVARLRNDAQPLYGVDGQLTYLGSGSILSKLEELYPYKGVAMFANYPTPDDSAPAYRRLAVQLALSGVLTLSYSDHVNDDVFRVYTARRKGGTDIEVRINGMLEGRSMISGALDVSAPHSDLLIGGWDRQPFAGDISEIVAVRGSVEDAALLGLEQGLIEKHRL